MSRTFVKLSDTIKIASGDARSDPLKTGGYFRVLIITAPATLPETVNLEVSCDGATFGVLQSGGVDIVIGAGKVVVIDMATFDSIQFFSSAGNAAADRTFIVYGVETS